MIIKYNEIGKEFEKIKKEKNLTLEVIHQRTNIPCSSLSDFFKGKSYPKFFNMIDQVAHVLNIKEVTLVFDESADIDEMKKVRKDSDYICLKDFLPEYKRKIWEIEAKNAEKIARINRLKDQNKNHI